MLRLALVTLLLAPVQDPTWETAPKGKVTGTLTFSRARPKQPIVVYLERKGVALPFTPPKNLLIGQKGARFNPSFAVVVIGQNVVFDNDEKKDIDHNVYTLGVDSRDFGIFPRGQDRRASFKISGEVRLHCSIHKFMDAKLFVAPNPAYVVVGSKEISFTLEGVPEGEYVLRTYQKAKRFHDVKMEISITKGRTTEVKVEMKR